MVTTYAATLCFCVPTAGGAAEPARLHTAVERVRSFVAATALTDDLAHLAGLAATAAAGAATAALGAPRLGATVGPP